MTTSIDLYTNLKYIIVRAVKKNLFYRRRLILGSLTCITLSFSLVVPVSNVAELLSVFPLFHFPMFQSLPQFSENIRRTWLLALHLTWLDVSSHGVRFLIHRPLHSSFLDIRQERL